MGPVWLPIVRGKAGLRGPAFCRISSMKSASRNALTKKRFTIYGLSTAEKSQRANAARARAGMGEARKVRVRWPQKKTAPFGTVFCWPRTPRQGWSASSAPGQASPNHNSANVRECQAPALKKAQRRGQGSRSDARRAGHLNATRRAWP